MGSFTGLSNAGKEAEGYPREYGAWNFQQFKDFLNLMQQYGMNAEQIRQMITPYYQNLMDQGLGSVGDIQDFGKQILPGFQDALNFRNSNFDNIWNMFSNVRDLPSLQKLMLDNLRKKGENIDSNQVELQNLIDSTYGNMAGREDETLNRLAGDISGEVDRTAGAINNDYGYLRNSASNLFGDLAGQTGGAYDEAQKRLELLRPGSEASAARAGRSFAPMMAATAGRIRRSGVDPNSSQAQSLLQGVEAERSRAMDDALATGNRDYALNANNLTLGKNNAITGLRRAGFDTESDLTRAQNALVTGINQRAGQEYRGDIRNNLASRQALESTRANATMDNTLRAFGGRQNFLDEYSGLEKANRDAELANANLFSNLTRERNDEALNQLDMWKNLFTTGLGWKTGDLSARNTGASGLGGIMGGQYNNMFQGANTAQNFGNNALNAYNTAYSYEAPKAGWGAKLIAQMAGPALSMIPGVGPILGQIVGQLGSGVAGAQGAFGGMGGMGGGQFGGGWGGGMGNPYAFSMQNPFGNLTDFFKGTFSKNKSGGGTSNFGYGKDYWGA